MESAPNMKDQSTVIETNVERGNSPPLTSSLHSRNSASSVEESAYLRKASLLRWIRLGLSALSGAVAVAIVGCTGHVLQAYNQSSLGQEWSLPLWPDDVDIRPTLGLMIPAILTVVASLLYVVFAVIPSPHSRTLYQVFLFLLTSSVAFIVTLFAVLFKQLLVYHFDTNTRDTLQTWTCTFYHGAKGYTQDTDDVETYLSGESMVPMGFSSSCKESMAGQWMTVGLLVIQIACVGVAVWGLVAEQKIKRSRQLRYNDEKCESELAE